MKVEEAQKELDSLKLSMKTMAAKIPEAIDSDDADYIEKAASMILISIGVSAVLNTIINP